MRSPRWNNRPESGPPQDLAASARPALHAGVSQASGTGQPLHGTDVGGVLPPHGLAVPDPLSRVHVLERRLLEDVFYPPHAPRTESPAYNQVHHELVHVQDLPCLVCGVRASTLREPKRNKFGARAMETHHAVIEWSLAKAVQLAKFNAAVLPKLRTEHPEEELYRQDFTRSQMERWIDHHPDNLWVLCDVHHRHKGVGVHAISGPIWGAQSLLRERYQLGSPECLQMMRRMMRT